MAVWLDAKLAAKLRAERARSGLTQRAVAARIGASQSLLCLWELGRAEPSLTALRQLAAVYGTTAARLVQHDISTGGGEGRTVADMPVPRRSPEDNQGGPR